MEFNQSEKDFYERSMSYIPKETVRVITDQEELKAELGGRAEGEILDYTEVQFRDMDLSGWDMSNLILYKSTFERCNLNGTIMDNCDADHMTFYECDVRNLKLTNSKARAVSFRYHDMEGIDISGSNIYASVLEDAHNQDKVIINDETRWYKMTCPEEGPFIAWKCCTDLRVVQMLVPADAKRCMATLETGRVSKVKVLSIKSIDESESFDWAQSTVDQDFYYEKGKWLEPANGFQEDRWKDSSPGIHFFMERQQCVDYQTK